MADQEDQNQNPLTEDPTFVPLTRSEMAEKSLPGFRETKPHESDSEYSDSSEEEDKGATVGFFTIEFRNQKIQELQRKAYYSVLNAFKTESATISDKRNEIRQKLMNELKITREVDSYFEEDILAQQQRSVSSPAATVDKEIQIVKDKSLTKPQQVKETCVAATSGGSVSGWGRVDPKSLVGKYVRVRLPDEEDWDEFIIKEYNADRDMHRLETTESNAMEMDEFLTWMDFRLIPCEDIMWQAGEKPDFGDNRWMDAE